MFSPCYFHVIISIGIVLTFAAITSNWINLKVEIWLTMFTMDWQIDQSIVLSLKSLVHRYMKAVLLTITATILFNREQAYMTCKSSGLQQQNKDFCTPHE